MEIFFRITEEQKKELKRRLHESHTATQMLGHQWDVADALCVVEKFLDDISITADRKA